MKNQYIGDINDYRKYGLLRILAKTGIGSILVVWMLTSLDRKNDGAKTNYLQNPFKYAGFDKELYEKLKKIRGNLDQNSKPPTTQSIEHGSIIPEARFFSDLVPDSKDTRMHWFSSLQKKIEHCDLIFLDPDNGIEVRSVKYGTKNSSKYVYWKELHVLWEKGKSILVYQHFPRIKRTEYMSARCRELSAITKGSSILSFKTGNVLFLLALQPEKRELILEIKKGVIPWELDKLECIGYDNSGLDVVGKVGL